MPPLQCRLSVVTRIVLKAIDQQGSCVEFKIKKTTPLRQLMAVY